MLKTAYVNRCFFNIHQKAWSDWTSMTLVGQIPAVSACEPTFHMQGLNTLPIGQNLLFFFF